MNFIDRETFFWARVKKGPGCWVFTGSKGKNGYGSMSLKNAEGKYWRTGAHRYSYTLHKGEIPPGMLVCHTCDNPPCVNPDHLFVGTVQDNALDMVRKGRCHQKGSDNNCSKFSDAQIRQVFELCAQGLSSVEIGRRVGISRNHVTNIRNGRRWKHLQAA